jgi:hypothetical protein
MATSIKRPSGLRFRRLFTFVKRKAFEYCESATHLKYTTEAVTRIIEHLKKKNESLKALSVYARQER